jgi:hypothetical protein
MTWNFAEHVEDTNCCSLEHCPLSVFQVLTVLLLVVVVSCDVFPYVDDIRTRPTTYMTNTSR